MIRKSKYRGKIKGIDEWIYGSLVEHPTGKMYIVKYRRGGAAEKYEVAHKSVGQFTGLLDKNGTEIYEGDVVRNDKYIGVVKWMVGRCCYQISPCGVYLSRKCEVLGQEIDNPALLKGDAL